MISAEQKLGCLFSFWWTWLQSLPLQTQTENAENPLFRHDERFEQQLHMSPQDRYRVSCNLVMLPIIHDDCPLYT